MLPLRTDEGTGPLRTHPEGRLALFLDPPYDREEKNWQPIVSEIAALLQEQGSAHLKCRICSRS